MNISFSGHKALVTGGTRGIGRSIAELLLDAGAEVWISGRSTRKGWWNRFEQCHLIAVDFEDSSSASRFYNSIRAIPFSLLVTCAGVVNPTFLASWDSSASRRIIEVNLNASMDTMAAVVPGMIELKNCRIVHVSSIAALVTRAGMAAYAASKGGVVSMVRSAALELAELGILVNAVCPAYTETDMLNSLDSESRSVLLSKVPMRRFCEPREVAHLVCFLLSSFNTFTTGQAITIDGGVTIH